MRRWIEDWRDRKDCQQWMLTNVHELYRYLGEEQIAREAVRFGLSLEPDHCLSELHLWASLDALHAGDVPTGMQHFMRCQRAEELEGFPRLLNTWVETMLHMMQSPDKATAFAEVKAALKEMNCTSQFFAEQPVYLAPYLRTVSTIAQQSGSMRAKLWSIKEHMRAKYRSWIA